MRRPSCWAIEDYRYQECPDPARRFRSLVSLHNHSRYSTEDLASLNRVMNLPYMRPLRGIVRRAFGLGWVEDLDYAEVRYHPPFTPLDVFRMERKAAASLGVEKVGVAITDHDEVAGAVELRAGLPAQSGHIGLGEELSVRFDGHLFHLGVVGLPTAGIAETHARLQEESRAGRLDNVFDLLNSAGCLVVLNHPLLPWKSNRPGEVPAVEFLKRYGWAIHALEYNGMRRQEENDQVLELARVAGKPVVGGGDSHLLAPSSVISGSPSATDFAGFLEEVKSGAGVAMVTPRYFAPLRWKLFLRVLSFMGQYRRIGMFRGEPVETMLRNRWVLLDPVGFVSRAFLRLAAGLRLVR